MKQFIFTLLLSALSITFGHAADENSTTENNTTTAPLRIMPLGDSITYGMHSYDEFLTQESLVGGYRQFLWRMLKDSNKTVDFVGSEQAGTAITPAIDPDNEGHPGWRMGDIANIAYGKMEEFQPDIVLLHIGTNDLAETSPDGVLNILNEIDSYENNSGKKIRVLVALIIPRQIADGRIDTFNKNLEKALQKRMLAGDRITIVDMYRGAHLTSSDYANDMHPNDTGYYKMAQVWFRAIMAPYNYNLRLFPTTLVDKSYIKSVTFNDAANSVDFTTEIPLTGITF